MCEMLGPQPCALTWHFWDARALRVDSGFRGDDSDFCPAMSHLKDLLWSSPCRQKLSDKKKQFCNFIIQRKVGDVRTLNASFSCPAQGFVLECENPEKKQMRKLWYANHFPGVGYFCLWSELEYTEWHKSIKPAVSRQVRGLTSIWSLSACRAKYTAYDLSSHCSPGFQTLFHPGPLWFQCGFCSFIIHSGFSFCECVQFP